MSDQEPVVVSTVRTNGPVYHKLGNETWGDDRAFCRSDIGSYEHIKGEMLNREKAENLGFRPCLDCFEEAEA